MRAAERVEQCERHGRAVEKTTKAAVAGGLTHGSGGPEAMRRAEVVAQLRVSDARLNPPVARNATAADTGSTTGASTRTFPGRSVNVTDRRVARGGHRVGAGGGGVGMVIV